MAKHLLYKCVIHAIQSNSGIGFHNSDQGHPAYALVAGGGEAGNGDTPNQNELYQMLLELSDVADGTGPVIENWQEFCELAFESYNAQA